jgi:hypothetical protein
VKEPIMIIRHRAQRKPIIHVRDFKSQIFKIPPPPTFWHVHPPCTRHHVHLAFLYRFESLANWVCWLSRFSSALKWRNRLPAGSIQSFPTYLC